MKKIFLALFILGGMLGISASTFSNSVLAQSLTPTPLPTCIPTITPTSQLPTMEVIQTVVFETPDFVTTPTPWGTVMPLPTCAIVGGQGINPSMADPGDEGGSCIPTTQTPTTPTPTAGTPIPNNCAYDNFAYIITPVNATFGHITNNGLTCADMGNVIHCAGVVSAIDTDNGQDTMMSLTLLYDSADSFYLTGSVILQYTNYGTWGGEATAVYSCNDLSCNYFSNRLTSDTFTSTISHDVVHNSIALWTWGGGLAGEVITYTYDITLTKTSACYEDSLQTPTPSPTPITTPGACSVGAIDTEIIVFEPPVIIPGACYTLLPAMNIDTPDFIITSLSTLGLNWDIPDNIGVPGIELCTQYWYSEMQFLGFDFLTVGASIVSVICAISIAREFRK